MRFTLEDYQRPPSTGRSRRSPAPAATSPKTAERTAVGLTAPTGAGKTVIATAVLEGLYFGTPSREPARPARRSSGSPTTDP